MEKVLYSVNASLFTFLDSDADCAVPVRCIITQHSRTVFGTVVRECKVYKTSGHQQPHDDGRVHVSVDRV